MARRKADLRQTVAAHDKAMEREAIARRTGLERAMKAPMQPIKNDADERLVDADDDGYPTDAQPP